MGQQLHHDTLMHQIRCCMRIKAMPSSNHKATEVWCRPPTALSAMPTTGNSSDLLEASGTTDVAI